MGNNLAWRIAWRYSLGHRRGRLGSFISLMAMAGLVLGISLLITVVSVMNGFDRELREKILALVPHIHIYSETAVSVEEWRSLATTVQQNADIEAVSPIHEAHGLLRYKGEVEPGLLIGLDPTVELEHQKMSAVLGGGLFETLKSEKNGLFLGAGLIEKLGIEVGSQITFILPNSQGNSASMGSFTLLGEIRTGTEMDNRLGLYSLRDTTLPLDLQKTEGLRLFTRQLFDAYPLTLQIMQNLPVNYRATTWQTTHGALYEAIQLSRQMVGFIVLLILGIAAFNVVASLVIVAADKQKEIAILKTVGAENRTIVRIFAYQGLIIGGIGVFFGSIGGAVLASCVGKITDWIQALFGIQLLDLSIYPVNYVPSDLQGLQILEIGLVSLILSLVASVYPALRSSRIRPAEILRCE